MDGITFRYLISMEVNLNFTMKLMDVVPAYLCGNLDSDIYMKVPKGIPFRNKMEQIGVYTVFFSRNNCTDLNNLVGCGTIEIGRAHV